MRTDDWALRCGRIAHAVERSRASEPSRQGSTHRRIAAIVSTSSAAMRLDPNTHAFVLATAFLTSISFALAAMQVIALAIHLFVPGAA